MMTNLKRGCFRLRTAVPLFLAAAGAIDLCHETSAQETGPSLPVQRAELEQPQVPVASPVPDVNTLGSPLQTASLSAPAEPGTLGRIIAKPLSGAAADSPFQSLLSGTDLDGWSIHEGRPGTWVREGDTIRANGSGAGWLMSERTFSDYVLRFEYRLSAGCNSGVAIRCSPDGNPTFTGMEVQLIDDEAPKYTDLKPTQRTGSLYYRVAPQSAARLAPHGCWNQCEIRCAGSVVEVLINGDLVNHIALRTTTSESLPETESVEVVPTSYVASTWTLADRLPTGRIALQSHANGIEFRQLEIHDLARQTASGLQIVELSSGDEAAPAVTAEDTVVIHYVGQLTDGQVFTDSFAFGTPVTIPLSDVIQGWKEGIVGMKPGARRRLIVPAALAYGPEGVENLIPPDATLVFEVELQGIER